MIYMKSIIRLYVKVQIYIFILKHNFYYIFFNLFELIIVNNTYLQMKLMQILKYSMSALKSRPVKIIRT